MTQITEIAPDMYRISTFIPEVNLQFNQFLVRDEPRLMNAAPSWNGRRSHRLRQLYVVSLQNL